MEKNQPRFMTNSCGQFGQEVLGEKTYYLMVSFKSEKMTPTLCHELIEKVIDTIGMKKAYDKTLHFFPVEGKGGIGFTFFQPITESYIIMDYWEELGGGYFNVCSCREYNPVLVVGLLQTFADMKVLKVLVDSIGIKEQE